MATAELLLESPMGLDALETAFSSSSDSSSSEGGEVGLVVDVGLEYDGD